MRVSCAAAAKWKHCRSLNPAWLEAGGGGRGGMGGGKKITGSSPVGCLLDSQQALLSLGWCTLASAQLRVKRSVSGPAIPSANQGLRERAGELLVGGATASGDESGGAATCFSRGRTPSWASKRVRPARPGDQSLSQSFSQSARRVFSELCISDTKGRGRGPGLISHPPPPSPSRGTVELLMVNFQTSLLLCTPHHHHRLSAAAAAERPMMIRNKDVLFPAELPLLFLRVFFSVMLENRSINALFGDTSKSGEVYIKGVSRPLPSSTSLHILKSSVDLLIHIVLATVRVWLHHFKNPDVILH